MYIDGVSLSSRRPLPPAALYRALLSIFSILSPLLSHPTPPLAFFSFSFVYPFPIGTVLNFAQAGQLVLPAAATRGWRWGAQHMHDSNGLLDALVASLCAPV